jgi:ribonuclease HII
LSDVKTSKLWLHDCALQTQLASVLCVGVDEVGRGPLAGNVVAACVILDLNALPINGLNDSKKLSEATRENLFEVIVENALAFGIGECSPGEIDRINILQATFLAMARALAAMRGGAPQAGLMARSLAPGKRDDLHLLVDGNKTIPGVTLPQQALVKGDGISASIAAASILAKVTRDRQVLALDTLYPQYGLAQHKGYPTETHREAVLRYGLTPVHRRSFCTKLMHEIDLFAT